MSNSTNRSMININQHPPRDKAFSSCQFRVSIFNAFHSHWIQYNSRLTNLLETSKFVLKRQVQAHHSSKHRTNLPSSAVNFIPSFISSIMLHFISSIALHFICHTSTQIICIHLVWSFVLISTSLDIRWHRASKECIVSTTRRQDQYSIFFTTKHSCQPISIRSRHFRSFRIDPVERAIIPENLELSIPL